MRVDPSPPPLLGLLVILQRCDRPVLRGRGVREEVRGGLEWAAVAEIGGAAAEALLDEPGGEKLMLLAAHREAAVGPDVDEARPGE